MGWGGLLLAVMGGPMAGIARSPWLIGSHTGEVVFAIGLGLVSLGVALLYVFPWRVFRPESFGALVVVMAATVSCGGTWIGLVGASEGPTMEAIFQHTRPWAMAVIAQVGAAFAWTALESMVLHRRLAKQLALGLAEPLVVNRVQLWAIACSASTTTCAVLIAAMARGRPPMTDPLSITLMAVTGIVVAVGFGLATFPPPSYAKRVRARAARHAGVGSLG